jgi:hypothetical protein
VNVHTTRPKDVGAVRATRDRIGKLLSAYPDVTDEDRKEILAFMKEGRHLDIGLLTANDQLRPKLDAFLADHQRHFALGALDVVRMLAVMVAAVTFCWLLWELVRPASL